MTFRAWKFQVEIQAENSSLRSLIDSADDFHDDFTKVTLAIDVEWVPNQSVSDATLSLDPSVKPI